MEAILTVNKKNPKAEEYIIKEKYADKETTYSFTNKDTLVNFLKDNIPVNDKKYTVVIDNDLNSTQKLILKHSTEKASTFQKKSGFDAETYEFKKNVGAAFDNTNASIEEKSDKIAERAAEYENQGSQKKINRALCAIMAEYCVEIYSQIFGGIDDAQNKDGQGANEKILINLKNTLNLLIQNDYLTHNFKMKPVDLISLRNNISRIFMNKMNKLKK